MSGHPSQELLAAFADGKAPVAERAGLESHLSSCETCRREVDGQKAVSKLVAGLPQAELPVGFMARLERRRLAGDSPAPFSVPGLGPWRIAAFAATGLLVGLVFFREVRYRLAPQMLGDAAYEEGIRSEMRVTQASESDAGVAEARRAIAERGAWGEQAAAGAAGDALQTAAQPPAAAPQEAPAAAPSAPEASNALQMKSLASRAAAFKGGGAPMGGGKSQSNEEIHDYLEREKSKMGIAEIVAPGRAPASPLDGIPDRPMSKDEAMDVMRTMTRQLSKLNREAVAKKNPTIALEGGRTPRLLGKADASAPMAAEDKKELAAAAGGAGSLAMVRGSVRVDEPASFDPAASARPPLAMAPKPAAKAAPARPLLPRGTWNATLGGVGTAGGAVITKAEDWADLWRRVGRSEPLPAVDFDKEMAVAVFADRDEAKRMSVTIVSLSEEYGSLVVRYRLKDEGGPGPSAAYHAVVAPRSDLPFSFVEVR